MHILVIGSGSRASTVVNVEDMGHETVPAANAREALSLARTTDFGAALLDSELNGDDALDLVSDLAKENPHLNVVLFAPTTSMEIAVEGLRRGAADFILKPFPPERLRQVLNRLTDARTSRARMAELEFRLATFCPALDQPSHNPGVQEAYDAALSAATASAPVLIEGESDTGKTVLAQYIHQNSARSGNPFVMVDCRARSPAELEIELFDATEETASQMPSDARGKVALANGGTLFLDHFESLSSSLQSKLLLLVQQNEYDRAGESQRRQADVRLIAVTDENLESAVQQGQFARELYTEFSGGRLRLPPLRDRPEDLMRIASRFLVFFAGHAGKAIEGFSDQAQDAIKRYNWPGNFRELRNALESAVMFASGTTIQPEELPVRVRHLEAGQNPNVQLGARVSLRDLENEHIRRILTSASSLEEASRILRIDPATLYRKRKRYAL